MTSKSPKRAFKEAIYGELARISKSLASPRRLELLDLLCQRPWTVEALSAESHMSIANASQHLKILRSARLVESRRKGLFVEYAVTSDEVISMARAIRVVAEAQLAEFEQITDRFTGNRDEFQSIDRVTLLRRLKDNAVVLLDVRPEDEYRHGHLAGARSIPIDRLEERLRELPKNLTIVAYCRGPFCLFASDAVRLLRERGYDALRYHEGVADWRAAGLAVISDNSPEVTN